jgi:flagellar assembly protein FliH
MEKFKFDREFSEGGEARATQPRAKRAYKPEEVEAARTQARAEGECSAVAQAEQAAAQSIAQLAKGLHEILSMARFALDEIHDDGTRLAATIARKLAVHAFEAAPESYFERAIGECLDLLRREPKIRIVIPAEAPPSLKAHLEALATAHGLGGHVHIELEAYLKGAECRLDWRSGGAEISLEDAFARMDAIIGERIAALQAAKAAAPQSTRAVV